MGREYRLGAPFGIPLFVQSWLLLLVGAIFGFAFLSRRPLEGAWILVLFGSILLHEWGHALAARWAGDRVLKVVLHPLGGVTYRAGLTGPRADFRITGAGPLVNLVLAAVAWGALQLAGPGLPFWASLVLFQLLWANVILAGFNLLPIHPLDGGGLARIALARRVGAGSAARLSLGLSLWTLVTLAAVLAVLGALNLLAVVLLAQLFLLNVMEMRQVGPPSFAEARAAWRRWRETRVRERAESQARRKAERSRSRVADRDGEVLEAGPGLLERALQRGLAALSPDERRTLILHRRLLEIRVDSADGRPAAADLDLLEKHLRLGRSAEIH